MGHQFKSTLCVFLWSLAILFVKRHGCPILSTFHHGCRPCRLEGPRQRRIPAVLLQGLLHDPPPQPGPAGPHPPCLGHLLMDLQAALLLQLLQMGSSHFTFAGLTKHHQSSLSREDIHTCSRTRTQTHTHTDTYYFMYPPLLLLLTVRVKLHVTWAQQYSWYGVWINADFCTSVCKHLGTLTHCYSLNSSDLFAYLLWRLMKKSFEE